MQRSFRLFAMEFMRYMTLVNKIMQSGVHIGLNMLLNFLFSNVDTKISIDILNIDMDY
jgi:hypothetical protein